MEASAGRFYFPSFPYDNESSYVQSQQLDSTTLQVACIFIVPKTGTIEKICISIRLASNPMAIRAGLYTLDGVNPSSALYGGSSTGSFTPAADSAFEITVNAAATEGDMIAAVFEWDSSQGVVNISGGEASLGFPVMTRYTTSWSRLIMNPNLWLKYSDGTYSIPAGCNALKQHGYFGFNANSTPNQHGNIIDIPFDMDAIGISVKWNSNYAIPYYLELFEDGVCVRQAAVPAYIAGAGKRADIYFDRKYTCRKGHQYIISLRNPSTGISTYIFKDTFDNPAVMQKFLGGKSRAVSRKDSGSWTESDTTFNSLLLIADGVPEPSINRRTSTGR